MRSDAKLAPALAALTSALLHVAFLASGLALPAREPPPRPQDLRNTWSARSVEVGTIPDSTPRSEPAPARPASAADAPANTPATKPEPAARTALVQETRAARTLDAPSGRDEVKPKAPIERPHAREPRPRPPPERGPAEKAAATPRSSAEPSATPTSAGSATSASEGSAASPAQDSGTFGAVGLPPGVRHLATAFARALPAWGYRDAAWSKLPAGKVGSASVTIHLGESGRIESVDVDPKDDVPPVIGRMIDRVVRLLQTGTFSLDPGRVSAGTERLTLEVTLSDRPANPDELAEPTELFAQSYTPPTHDRPGFARFTLNSGRHVEVVLRVGVEP